jgi:tetratricopeptide (TPR) repeat protein
MKKIFYLLTALIISSSGCNQKAEQYFNKGLEKGKQKDYLGAIADYTKAIEINPKYMEAYYNRGMTNIAIGQKDRGCMDLSKAGELGSEKAYEKIKKLCN